MASKDKKYNLKEIKLGAGFEDTFYYESKMGVLCHEYNFSKKQEKQILALKKGQSYTMEDYKYCRGVYETFVITRVK